MQVFIVGGAVRDKLLQRPITDKDFVVVGATPEDMIAAGFIQVGSDFPVFLHPKTKAEYALARTERKSGKGYKGFEVYASPEVTLEQDLSRRDLTINAMAIEVKGLEDDTPITGEVIDPYGGQRDIKDKIFRHVSEAFIEDPLRVLRIARFYGRFYDSSAKHNFSIAPDTIKLIQTINKNEELQYLTAERVWQETSRALMQPSPQAYFDCLIQIGSLPYIMSNLASALTQEPVKQGVFEALQLSGQMSLALHQRWAILMVSFESYIFRDFDNKTLSTDTSTVNQSWSKELKQIGTNLKVPKKMTQFAIAYAEGYPSLHRYPQSSAESIAALIAHTKADKASNELFELMQVHKIIELARQQLQFERYIKAYKNVTIHDIDSELTGKAIGDALAAERIRSIEKTM